MDEVAGPVVALALILAAVFVPTVFIAGITGRLYQQFAMTIAISVALSAFNALSLSPAMAALLLRPKKEGKARGPLRHFYDWFNRYFEKTRHLYLGVSLWFIRKAAWVLVALLLVGVAAVLLANLPTAFVPEEDQGYAYAQAQLPFAASLERTDAVAKKIENILKNIPGVEYYTTVEGFSLLSQVQATYNVFFFVTLKPWSERTKASERFDAIKKRLNDELGKLPEAQALPFRRRPFPASGRRAVLRSCSKTGQARRTSSYLTQNLNKFLAAAKSGLN
jgi:HAE1 family hydrophobic/amphiphilic exporter-1